MRSGEVSCATSCTLHRATMLGLKGLRFSQPRHEGTAHCDGALTYLFTHFTCYSGTGAEAEARPQARFLAAGNRGTGLHTPVVPGFTQPRMVVCRAVSGRHGASPGRHAGHGKLEICRSGHSSRYAHLQSLSNFCSCAARGRPNQEPSMAPKGNKKRAAPSAPASEWAAVPDAASDRDVLKAVMEVQRFWIHGDTVC